MYTDIPDIIIAVDGYSSTGKSTFARALAQRLNFTYLDSGALYRGVTLYAQREALISRINVIRPELEQRLQEVDLHFDSQNRLYCGQECIEPLIRTIEVSRQVSPIAAVPYVRTWVDGKLHFLASSRRVVMDGRDIGTTVFPDAEIKIFLTAAERVRAQRRFDEMCAKGVRTSMEEVVGNLRHRDFIDSHREASPLKRAPGSFLLDNSRMTISEELSWAVGLIRGKFSIYEDQQD